MTKTMAPFNMPYENRFVETYNHDTNAALRPGECLYGKEIIWTVNVWGDKKRVHTTGHHSSEDCDQMAFIMANDMGWMPRKWFEFWRWGDKQP